MRVIIKFSSIFKVISGVDQESVEVADGTTIDQLTQVLSQTYPELPFENSQTFFVVNDKVSKRDQVLANEDQVRIFQMFAGG